MQGELMTSAEVAEYFKVNVSTVCRWRLDGVGPAYVRIGSVYRYPRSLLTQWVVDQVRREAS
jgi:excisionase family DNA binding protein